MDGVKIRVSRSSGAKNASAVNQRLLQNSSTLNRRFVKKPTPAPRIRSSAGAASRTLKSQTKKHILITKENSVQIQPQQAKRQQQQTIQATEKVVQKAEQKLTEQDKMRQRLAKKSGSGAISLKDLAAAKVVTNEQIAPAQDAPVAKVAKARMAARKAPAPKQLSAQELKDRAIKRALREVSTMGDASDNYDSQIQKQHFWQRKKFVAAAAMAVVSLALLGYLVGINMPDISVRVAAIHSGIEKAYPSYVPSNYRLDGLVKEENGRITMAFKNDADKKFTLMEEKSSWDSSAVLTNYVQKNWGASYSIAKGQGLTIYVSGSNAAWVNGGVFYVITDDSNSLSSSDLHDIAVSL